MTWHKLDTNQKTMIFLAVVGVAVLCLLWPASAPQPKRLPPPIRQAPLPPQRLPANRTVVSVPPRNTAPAVALPPPVAGVPVDQLLGYYNGHEMVSSERGNCGLNLELRRSEKAGEFTAFAHLVCRPSPGKITASKPGQAMDIRTKTDNPLFTTLTGTADGGSIRLHAVKNYGMRDARIPCEMTTLTLTPGGTNILDAEWREAAEPTGLCQGAQMQMGKIAR